MTTAPQANEDFRDRINNPAMRRQKVAIELQALSWLHDHLTRYRTALEWYESADPEELELDSGKRAGRALTGLDEPKEDKSNIEKWADRRVAVHFVGDDRDFPALFREVATFLNSFEHYLDYPTNVRHSYNDEFAEHEIILLFDEQSAPTEVIDRLDVERKG